MTKPKYAESYPPELAALIEEAASVPRVPITLSFPTSKAAIHFRFYIYSYIAALQHSIRGSSASRPSRSHDLPALTRLLSLARTLRFLVRGSSLIIEPSELDPRAQQVASFLSDLRTQKAEPFPEPQEPAEPTFGTKEEEREEEEEGAFNFADLFPPPAKGGQKEP